MRTWALVAVLGIAGCSTAPTPEPPPVLTPTPSPLPSGYIEIEIVTHCGLHWPRIEYDGQLWRFDVEEQPNPPPDWDNPWAVVQIKPGLNGAPIVIGPGGSEWQLIPAEPEPPSTCS